jgi:hypothetical protein
MLCITCLSLIVFFSLFVVKNSDFIFELSYINYKKGLHYDTCILAYSIP